MTILVFAEILRNLKQILAEKAYKILIFIKRMSWRKKTSKKSNNRTYVLMAVVFLLFLGCVYKLYQIQIVKGDYFSDLAGDQHRVHSELKPGRGEILLEKKGEEQEDYYALATNRDFALVYAVPKDIKNPEELSEKLYKFFDQEELKKKVEEDLAREDREELNRKLKEILLNVPDSERESGLKEAKRKYRERKNSPEWREEREEKISEKIEARKKNIVSNYKRILSKENDPYEPLKKKVLPEELKKMYLFLDKDDDLALQNLKIRNGRMYQVKDGEELRFKLEGISHLMQSYRYYPEEELGSHLLGFVSNAQGKPRGSYGLEGFFNKELAGRLGYIKSVQESEENSIIINDREYRRAIDGSDLVLTLDRAVQFQVCEKLNQAARRHGADGGSVVVINPQTGAIMAMCSWPNFNPNNYSDVDKINIFNNPVVFDEYEPGSVFKTITMAVALNENKINPRTTYIDKGKITIADHKIKNSDFSTHGPHGKVDMNYVLEHSLNTGAIFAMERTGPKVFADYVKRFGFGNQTGVELEAEADGNINNLTGEKIRKIYAATASFGQGITATPLQMTMAYAAIANNGILMKPYLVKEIIDPSGVSEKTKPVQVRKIISEEASTLLSGMLVNVVEGGHAKHAAVPGYYVGGKTGTAEVASARGGYGSKTIHTFVGFAPVEEPKFVMLVKLDDPKDVQYSASSAAPLFGELAEFMLNYYQVPKAR